MKTALLLIDLQNDYFPDGRMELEGSPAAAGKARQLLDAARTAGVAVVHVRHVALQPGATFFLPDSPGAEIYPEVAPLADEEVLTKHYPNAFRDTGLHALLQSRGVHRLVFAGMMTHMCVDASVRAAFDLEYRCVVAHDACATRALEWHGRAIPAAQVHGTILASLGAVYGLVLPAAEVAGGFRHCA